MDTREDAHDFDELWPPQTLTGTTIIIVVLLVAGIALATFGPIFEHVYEAVDVPLPGLTIHVLDFSWFLRWT